MTDKSSNINGAKYFSLGLFQNYLVFIPAKRHIKYFTNTTRVKSWKSNRMSKEIIENITKLDNNLVSTFVDPHLLLDMDFNGDCLIKSDISIRTKVINLHISYTLDPQLGNLNINFTLVNCLFRSVKLNKNADIGKYKYSGCGIGFDSRSDFYLQMEAMKKMSLILEMI